MAEKVRSSKRTEIIDLFRVQVCRKIWMKRTVWMVRESVIYTVNRSVSFFQADLFSSCCGRKHVALKVDRVLNGVYRFRVARNAFCARFSWSSPKFRKSMDGEW